MGYASALTLSLGELKSLTMTTTVDLDSFGQIRFSPIPPNRGSNTHSRFYWGTKKICWDIKGSSKDNGAKVA